MRKRDLSPVQTRALRYLFPQKPRQESRNGPREKYMKGFTHDVLSLYGKKVDAAKKASMLQLQYIPTEKPGV
jgi:hypothetical protein